VADLPHQTKHEMCGKTTTRLWQICCTWKETNFS